MSQSSSRVEPARPESAPPKTPPFLPFFLSGLMLWVIAGILIGVPSVFLNDPSGASNILFMLPGLVAGVLALFMAFEGSGWVRADPYESTAIGGMKMILIMLIAITGVGMIVICYWTGKALISRLKKWGINLIRD